jgi:hypothetical protein
LPDKPLKNMNLSAADVACLGMTWYPNGIPPGIPDLATVNGDEAHYGGGN